MANFDVKKLGTETCTVKSFLYGFPRLPSKASRSEIFNFINNVAYYCGANGIYVPPVHTMRYDNSYGAWSVDLPPHYMSELGYYDGILQQALTMKQTNLQDCTYAEGLLTDREGMNIIWCLAYAAGHPNLNPGLLDISTPYQRRTMNLTEYLQAWEYYLHMGYIRGTFYSDRYFLETFATNLDSSYDTNLKPNMVHFVRRLPIDSPVPPSFHPCLLLTHLTHIATFSGIKMLSLSVSPQEKQTQQRTRPVRAIETDNSVSPINVRQVDTDHLDFLEDSDILQICQLAASSESRKCDLCMKTDHLLLHCPRLQMFRDDPMALRRMLRTFTQLRDGSDSNSNNSTSTTSNRFRPRTTNRRPGTPPTSNRSLNVRALDQDDTDDDGTAGNLTDDEGPDFI
jgi:hypothetical protein